MAKCIPCSRDRFAIVDDEDYARLIGVVWCVGNANRYYAVHRRGDVHVYMHRLILTPPQGFVVDHINGNARDNRRCNLRIVTKSEDRRNARPQMAIPLNIARAHFPRHLHWSDKFNQYVAQLESQQMLAALPDGVRTDLVLPDPDAWVDRRTREYKHRVITP